MGDSFPPPPPGPPDGPGEGGWGAPPPSQGGWGAPPPPQGGWGQSPPPAGGGGQPPGGWGGGPPYVQGYQPPIPNHLVWAILTTVFCCLPAGIVSIVFAAQVSSKQAAGDIQGALDASRKARTWAIVSAVLAAVFALLWIPIAIGIGLFGAWETSGPSGIPW